jgi:nucleotide-binding universal stress UspA family protein
MSNAPPALARTPASGSRSATSPGAGNAPHTGVAGRVRTGLGMLVGYDGSSGSQQALRWAARQARARKVVLTVCQAWGPGFPILADDEAVLGFARRSGERVLAEGLRLAGSIMEATDVRPMLAPGTAAAVLCEHSREADAVVTGARGRGGMAGLLLGSVAEHIAAHAHGAVVVVRGHWSPAAEFGRGSVVVGADGSPRCRAAVDFAFGQAALSDVPLLALCALADAPGSLADARACQDDFEQTIAEALERYPRVAVHRSVVPGGARSALLAACRDAQLVVVGARGRGGITGMSLGTVSRAVLHHAPCPAAVVHIC